MSSVRGSTLLTRLSESLALFVGSQPTCVEGLVLPEFAPLTSKHAEQRTHPEVIRIPSVFLTRNSGWKERAKNGCYEEEAGGASPLPSIGPHSHATMPKGIKSQETSEGRLR